MIPRSVVHPSHAVPADPQGHRVHSQGGYALGERRQEGMGAAGGPAHGSLAPGRRERRDALPASAASSSAHGSATDLAPVRGAASALPRRPRGPSYSGQLVVPSAGRDTGTIGAQGGVHGHAAGDSRRFFPRWPPRGMPRWASHSSRLPLRARVSPLRCAAADRPCFSPTESPACPSTCVQMASCMSRR